jgi:predicted dehydrogenase
MPEQLRVGILGLWRGASFAHAFAANEHTQLVAGCDFNEATRQSFTKSFPSVQLYDDYDAFLAQDLDLVMICSYCPSHGPHAEAALQAGKHVLSEVTAFHTLAEGVALVRAVEETGLTYMMAENYCYFAYTEEMRQIFQEGRLGDFMYAECEYVHDIRYLMLNPDGSKHWRAWLPPIYYCTHPSAPSSASPATARWRSVG